MQQPIALAVLLDTSASMESKLETAQEAAIGFARRMRPSDLMEVIDFDRAGLDPAGLHQRRRGARARDPPGHGQRLDLALQRHLHLAEGPEEGPRRPATTEIRREAIVVLSDGDDTSSLVAYDEVLDLAKRSETAIYAIGLKQNDSGGRDFKEAEFVLRQLSQETGGRAFYPGTVAELPKIYEQIAQELSSQYAIGYVSKNAARNGAWRRLSVQSHAAGADRPDPPGLLRAGHAAS